MRELCKKSRSLKRLLSVTVGRRRSRDEEDTHENASPVRESKQVELMLDVSSPSLKPTWRCFSYNEVHKATNGFHKDNLVGRGGHAEVYRGVMEDGRAIAVKRMMRAVTDEQREKDFLTELGTVGHVRHPNVSALLGCCIDRDLHLIFEFSSRGSVSSNLHDENSPPMAWKLRYDIAVGTARGLHYLHTGCQRRIIHRDIKASNILLTTSFEPQISDFGLAKWLPSEWTHRAVAPIEGTFGCLAPEYFMHGIVDEKTDVFAFGVFLLEIISGRKPVDGSHGSLLSWVDVSCSTSFDSSTCFTLSLSSFNPPQRSTTRQSFDWLITSLQARPFLDDGNARVLVDPRLREDYDLEQLRRLTFSASLCVRAEATLRPSMTEVVELLEGGEISQDRWTTPEEVEEEFWGFHDLVNDDDDDDGGTPPSSLGSPVRSDVHKK